MKTPQSDPCFVTLGNLIDGPFNRHYAEGLRFGYNWRRSQRPIGSRGPRARVVKPSRYYVIDGGEVLYRTRVYAKAWAFAKGRRAVGGKARIVPRLAGKGRAR